MTTKKRNWRTEKPKDKYQVQLMENRGYEWNKKKKRWVKIKKPPHLRPRNLMNTRSNKELTLGHSILHKWRRNNWREKPSNWSKKEIVKEHTRLVRVAKERDLPMGTNHRTPIRTVSRRVSR